MCCLPLQLMDVRNAVVVVSRWYGGVHLGPDRFKHINNCARTVIQDTHTGLTVSSAVKESLLCAHMWRPIILAIPFSSYTNGNGNKT